MKKILLVMLTVALTASIFAGCGASSGSAGGGDKELNFYIWSEYIPQSVLDGFTKETGIKVNMATYSSNEEMVAKLLAGGTSQYDLVVPSNYVIQAMVQQKLIQPLDKANIPNISNIDPNMINMDFDKGNVYTVPYMVSFTLLVENKKTCPVEIKSFNDLLDPRLKGSLVVVDDSRELIGAALLALGYSFNDTDQAKLDQAKDWLLKLVPNIKAYDSDSPKTKLISGEVSAGLVWNGEAALALPENPDLEVVWPKEGNSMAIDNFAVIAGAKHKEAAEKFINYVLDPQVSKSISDEYPYTNPNKAAQAFMSDTYMNNPASNVPSEWVKKATLSGDIGDAASNFDKIWSEIKTEG